MTKYDMYATLLVHISNSEFANFENNSSGNVYTVHK